MQQMHNLPVCHQLNVITGSEQACGNADAHTPQSDQDSGER